MVRPFRNFQNFELMQLGTLSFKAIKGNVFVSIQFYVVRIWESRSFKRRMAARFADGKCAFPRSALSILSRPAASFGVKFLLPKAAFWSSMVGRSDWPRWSSISHARVKRRRQKTQVFFAFVISFSVLEPRSTDSNVRDLKASFISYHVN